jgi:cobalt/nickel transport system ATP-binding protein
MCVSRIILEARDVRYRYPHGVEAVKKVSFHIRRGEKVALVGPNGAGKSTLLLMLNGMLRPDSGNILFDNTPISYDRNSLREIRRRVGFVFQNPDRQIIAPTVYQDVAFGPVNLGYTEEGIKQAVASALRYVGLEGFERRPPHQLSGGEKKRVAIAGVLAMDPDVLVFDEPTSVLDPAGSEDIMELLEELHQNGKTIIISTHDVELAYPWADRVILLRNGEILQEGIPEVAFGDPGLVRKAHLSVPILLELYQELVMRGLARQAKKPKTVLDMINIIEGIRKGSMTGKTEGCGMIRVADVDMLAHGTIREIIADLGITGVGVMGSRAKERLQKEGIYPDYTYAVIDRSILRGMIGESILIITSGGMVGKVIERVLEFEKETGFRLPAEIIRAPCSPDRSKGDP